MNNKNLLDNVVGIDSVRSSIINTQTFKNFLKRFGIICKVDIDKKSQIAKKNPTNIYEYAYLEKSNTKLNCIKIITLDKELEDICRIRHKRKGYYCKVEFASLYQPQRKNEKIDIIKYKILSSFIKRFEIRNFDLAADFIKKDVNVSDFSNEISNFLSGESFYLSTTYYMNNCKKNNIEKMIIYDKYKKEKFLHKKKLTNALFFWKRLEITILCNQHKKNIKNRILFNNKLFLINCIKKLNRLLNNVVNRRDFGLNQTFLKSQIEFLNDKRKLSFFKRRVVA